jgi:hypothetical protein
MFATAILTPAVGQAQTVSLGPFTQTYMEVNPCTDETVLVTATTRVFMYSRVDASGGMHLTFRALTHGRGDSMIPLNPKRYQFNHESVSEGNAAIGGAFEQTTVDNYVLIRQGNDPSVIVLDAVNNDDFTVKQTIHLTISSNGVVTADVANGHASCPTM